MSRREKTVVRQKVVQQSVRAPIPPGRKWLFRTLAMMLPVLLLGMVEVGLRLGGYGYDTAFFKEERDASGGVSLINNDEFTFRFFPPELSRCAAPFKIDAVKPVGVRRIFIFGESAAMGDPQPSVGPSRILEMLLRERFPGERFEVVNLGITAINSHVILPMAREVAARGQGDIWILYIGNNEMVGPFGAATVFGNQAPPLAAVRLNLAVQRTRVGQLAVALLRRFAGKSSDAGWGGMSMFLENQVPPSDPRRETIYRSFQKNLQDIVDAGMRSGAQVVLSTMSVNLRDCPPFGSLSAKRLTSEERVRFQAEYTNGIAQLTRSNSLAAVQAFERAADLDPDFAELQFRWAGALESPTNSDAAARHFQRACDADSLPFRADTHINAAIRAVAGIRAEGIVLCDAEKVLAGAGKDGVAGAESFFEHVHFNFDGNYRLARVWAEHVSKLLPETVRGKASEGWATQDVCERAIGLSDWNRMSVIATIGSRLRQPPLAGQFTNARRNEALQRQWSEIMERARRSGSLSEARAGFIAALSRSPEDDFVRENFAVFLRSIGDKPAALAEYQKTLERTPHDFFARIHCGKLLGELGQPEAAVKQLSIAARQRPHLPDAWFERGLVRAAASNHVEALADFDRALKLQPADFSTRTYRARMLVRLGRRAEAIRDYRDLIGKNPERWEAHLELAELFAVAGDAVQAIPEYEAAVRLNPHYPKMRINLGVMLARQNRFDEAVRQFESVLENDPTNSVAKELLDQLRRQRGVRR